jgi:RNA polymerase sigma factor (sigma-70 family)
VDLPPFQVFLDEHAERLFKFIAVRVGPAEVEDCFQETVLAALRAWPKLDNDDNLPGWLYTIARRKTVDHHRGRARRPVPLRETPESTEVLRLPDTDLWDLVRNLPPKQSEAIYHRFVGDLSFNQIGRAMDITEEAARQNVRQGIRKLRTTWKNLES